MDWIERWRLSEGLNAFQIALLMAGYNPADTSRDSNGNWPAKIYREISAYLIALQHAVLSSSIEAIMEYEENNSYQEVDWDRTRIDIKSLTSWIKARGFHDNFFVTEKYTQTNHSFDSSSPFYSAKLDAALQAWQAVSSNPALLRGKSPKQALEAWLTENAARFGLIRPDGSPNKLGIEEVAKVANWKPHGGAPPTPASESAHDSQATGGQVQQNHPTFQPNQPTPNDSNQPYDDDIPF